MNKKKLLFCERLQLYQTSKIEREKLFDKLCRHLKQGYSLESFSEISTKTLRSLIKDFPGEFNDHLLEEAMQEGRNWWESVGRRQSNGECLGNSRTWFYNMSNRYGWRDKVDIETEHKGSVGINIISYANQQASQHTTDNSIT